MATAAIAQLGERQTEDLEVPGSIPGLGILLQLYCLTQVSFLRQSFSLLSFLRFAIPLYKFFSTRALARKNGTCED